MRKLFVLSVMLLFITGLAQAQSSDPPLCSEADWEKLVGLEDDYYALLNRSFLMRDLDTLIEVANTYVQWRAELLPQLPNCHEAREIGILMVQMVGDGVLTSILEKFMGVPAEENPFIPSVKEGSTRIYELYLREEAAEEAATETSTDEEVLCSLFETGADFDLTAGYADLLDAVHNAGTMEDFLQTGASQVEWRGHLWRQLPVCAAVFDTAYLLSHLTSDLLALIALVSAGVDIDSNPYLESISSSESALTEFFNERSHQQAPEHVAALKLTLPPCGTDVLESIPIEKDSYLDLVFQMNAGVYSVDELTAFAEAMLAWRDNYLPKVPPCEEAVAIALMETWLAGDFISDTVAMWIGVPAEDNAFAKQRSKDNVRLTDLAMDLRSADASATPATTAVMLPACDEAQLDEVFGNLLTNFQNLTQNAASISDASSFLSYAYYQAFWRLFVWEHLPPCSEAFAMAMLMNEYATDAVSYHAFRFINVADEVNPFRDKLGHLLERFDELTAASGRDL